MAKLHHALPLDLPKELLAGWQNAADIMVEVMGAPIGLVTRVRDGNLDVLVASRRRGNPYEAGAEVRLLGSGSYCEEVVRTRGLLRVTNAKKSPAWRNAPPAQIGLQAYMGLPLFLPGGHTFGTINVLDQNPHAWGAIDESLLFRFKDLVETQLSLLVHDREQRERARLLASYQDELKQLREVFPICPSCRNIRNDAGYWEAVEEYFLSHAMKDLGQGICPDCAEHQWGEPLLDPEPMPLPLGLGSGSPAKA